MYPLLSQTDPTAGASLTSVAGVILATWLLTAIAKQLISFKGKATLIVALVISLGLTAVSIWGTKTLEGDPVTIILAVLMGVAAAAGIDISGKTLFRASSVVVLSSCLLLSGCKDIPASLVRDHLNAVEPHHKALIAEHRPQDMPTWAAHYKSMRDLVDASEGTMP